MGRCLDAMEVIWPQYLKLNGFKKKKKKNPPQEALKSPMGDPFRYFRILGGKCILI